jgi:hypothetical protein
MKYQILPPPSLYTEKEEVYTGCQWGDLRESNHLEDLDIDGRVILKWFFKKWDGEPLDWSDSWQGQMASCREYGNERSDFIKCGKILD